MPGAPILQHVANNQIDKQQWDDCIINSPNGLIYATSFYLDNLCPNWTALTGENYSWVMPITAKRKFGISYLYQPPFTQQSGVFAKDEAVIVPWEEIVSWLQNQFSFWEYSFNFATPANVFTIGINVNAATNFILPLQPGYRTLYHAFHKDHQRNIRRSEKFRLVYRKLNDYTIAIDKYEQHYSHRMKHVSVDDYNNFKNLAAELLLQNKLICRETVNQQNELMATVLLLKDEKRLYNLMNTTTAAGRKVEANHFLINSVIREFAGRDLVFDFEGSDLPGVHGFYKNFGAINQPFYRVKYNNLPWPVKLFKR